MSILVHRQHGNHYGQSIFYFIEKKRLNLTNQVDT